MQFGRSSEKLDRQIEQLELRLEELQTSQAENKAGNVAAKQSPLESPANAPVRRSLPEHLPRETRKYLPKHKQCPDCGGTLKPLGEDVSEILEYVEVRFKVIRQIRPEAGLRGLRSHRASGSTESTDRARHRWSRTVSPCISFEIR